MDVRGRQQRAAGVAAADPAVCRHAVPRRGGAVLPDPDEAADVARRAGGVRGAGDGAVHRVHLCGDDGHLHGEQLHREHVVGDGGDPGVFGRGEGGGAAGAGEGAGAVAAVRVRGDDPAADAAVHAAAGVSDAVCEHPARAGGRDCGGVRAVAVRLSAEPGVDQAAVQPAGRADVQGERGGGVALAPQPRDVPHAQFRLRPAAAAVADGGDLCGADIAAVLPHAARAQDLQLPFHGGG